MIKQPILKVGEISEEENQKLIELTHSDWGEYSTGSPAQGMGRLKIAHHDFIRELLEPYYGTIKQIEDLEFHKLKPGQVITEHQDTDRNPPDLHVCHIPVKTNKDATLTFASIQKHFELNTIYEVNYSYVHSAKNSGETDRIHLFIQFRN